MCDEYIHLVLHRIIFVVEKTPREKLEGRSDENGRLWERDDLTLAATAWCVLTRPVVGIVDRLEELFIVAAVRHASVEIARPLPFGSPYRVDMRANKFHMLIKVV